MPRSKFDDETEEDEPIPAAIPVDDEEAEEKPVGEVEPAEADLSEEEIADVLEDVKKKGDDGTGFSDDDEDEFADKDDEDDDESYNPMDGYMRDDI